MSNLDPTKQTERNHLRAKLGITTGVLLVGALLHGPATHMANAIVDRQAAASNPGNLPAGSTVPYYTKPSEHSLTDVVKHVENDPNSAKAGNLLVALEAQQGNQPVHAGEELLIPKNMADHLPGQQAADGQ